jgi:hypothetical protein
VGEPGDSRAAGNGPDGHDGHDPEQIVRLLDPDRAPAEDAAAKALILACTACAVLHADLLALAATMREVPAPPRPRDFTLTPAIAATLAREAAGEPLAPVARLTSEMPNARPMDATSDVAAHRSHDRLLIASLLDRDVAETERLRGEEQLAACTGCANLFNDLVALSEATRVLPTPARRREYTLSEADARRLQVGGWRRLLRLIGSSRDAFTRPLAVGLTTLGLAGLLVATLPAAFVGVGGATSLSTVGNRAAEDAAGAAPEAMTQASPAPSEPTIAASLPSEAAPSAAAPRPGGSPVAEKSAEPDGLFVGQDSTADGQSLESAREPFGVADDGPISMSLVVVATLLLVVGLGLFGLRWTARRLGDG